MSKVRSATSASAPLHNLCPNISIIADQAMSNHVQCQHEHRAVAASQHARDAVAMRTVPWTHVVSMPTSSLMEQRTPTTMPARPMVIPDSRKPVALAQPSSRCAIGTSRTFACRMNASQRKISWHPAQKGSVLWCQCLLMHYRCSSSCRCKIEYPHMAQGAQGNNLVKRMQQ